MKLARRICGDTVGPKGHNLRMEKVTLKKADKSDLKINSGENKNIWKILCRFGHSTCSHASHIQNLAVSCFILNLRAFLYSYKRLVQIKATN